jgi:hypothetical protein
MKSMRGSLQSGLKEGTITLTATLTPMEVCFTKSILLPQAKLEIQTSREYLLHNRPTVNKRREQLNTAVHRHLRSSNQRGRNKAKTKTSLTKGLYQKRIQTTSSTHPPQQRKMGCMATEARFSVDLVVAVAPVAGTSSALYRNARTITA